MYKHHLLFTFLLTTTSLLCMQPIPLDIQKKLVAARLHNRTHCPLATLPREIQDQIAQHLEFNDRESDEEFVRNYQKITNTVTNYMLHKDIPLDKILLDKLRPYESRRIFSLHYSSFVHMIHSRDKSKVLMLKNYNFGRDEKGYYIFIYDIRNKKELYSKFYNDVSIGEFSIPLALSNDGKFFIQKSIPGGMYSSQIFSTVRSDMVLYSMSTLKNFNKQSTKYISSSADGSKYYQSLIWSVDAEEHQKRSKKTLALYLHQKGICKPFNYQQEPA